MYTYDVVKAIRALLALRVDRVSREWIATATAVVKQRELIRGQVEVLQQTCVHRRCATASAGNDSFDCHPALIDNHFIVWPLLPALMDLEHAIEHAWLWRAQSITRAQGAYRR